MIGRQEQLDRIQELLAAARLDHAGAFADAGEAVELASELGFVADAAPALEMLAWQHAARGSQPGRPVRRDP